VLATHHLTSGGLAMSTIALRRWSRGGAEMHHIVDPRTGTSSRSDLVAVAVAAPSTARAEALAKVALILGATPGAAFLARCGVEAWLMPLPDVDGNSGPCVIVGGQP
jgi:thiamine biosynthesis lipoprotein